MKSYIYNIGYFILEMFRVIKANLLSNIFSVIGTGLILFLLGMVFAGGSIGSSLVTQLEKEAQISAYFNKNTSETSTVKLIEQINKIDGVWDAHLVDETQAKELMKNVLGEEAGILDLFDYNPFEAFIEINMHIDSMDTALEKVETIEGIEYVRNNREVLDKLKNITQGLKVLGYLVLVAVSVTTLIIISHMIRQGIYNNKEQINTMRLLGAPKWFIGLPFMMSGLLLTLSGGILALGGLLFFIDSAYITVKTTLLFLPLPPNEEITSLVSMLISITSVTLGILGSLFGLISIRKDS